MLYICIRKVMRMNQTSLKNKPKSNNYKKLNQKAMSSSTSIQFTGTQKKDIPLFNRIKSRELSPLKESVLIAEADKAGYNPKDIAEYTNMSVSHVYNCIKINKFPAKVKEYIRTGQITPSEAVDQSRNTTTPESCIKQIEIYIRLKAERSASKLNPKLMAMFAAAEYESMAKTPLSRSDRNMLKKKLNDLLSSVTSITKTKLDKLTNSYLNQVISESEHA